MWILRILWKKFHETAKYVHRWIPCGTWVIHGIIHCKAKESESQGSPLSVGLTYQLQWSPRALFLPRVCPHRGDSLKEASILHGSLVVKTVKNLPAMQETWVQSLVGKIPWRRAWQPTPVFLPGESPWTEEPSGLWSMGLQRIGRNWAQHSTAASRNAGGLFNSNSSFNSNKSFGGSQAQLAL